jgi:hypothetical protein
MNAQRADGGVEGYRQQRGVHVRYLEGRELMTEPVHTQAQRARNDPSSPTANL